MSFVKTAMVTAIVSGITMFAAIGGADAQVTLNNGGSGTTNTPGTINGGGVVLNGGGNGTTNTPGTINGGGVVLNGGGSGTTNTPGTIKTPGTVRIVKPYSRSGVGTQSGTTTRRF